MIFLYNSLNYIYNIYTNNNNEVLKTVNRRFQLALNPTWQNIKIYFSLNTETFFLAINQEEDGGLIIEDALTYFRLMIKSPRKNNV